MIAPLPEVVASTLVNFRLLSDAFVGYTGVTNIQPVSFWGSACGLQDPVVIAWYDLPAGYPAWQSQTDQLSVQYLIARAKK